MNPEMNQRDGEKRVETGRETFPADDHAAVFPLEPGKRPLRLESWHPFFADSIALRGGAHPLSTKAA
jgi:hypothetical protein